jgi:hypothetical protein
LAIWRVLSFQFVSRSFLALIGCGGLIWGGLTVNGSMVADDLRRTEDRALRSEAFSESALTSILDSSASVAISACDTHAQRALLLVEMLLADAKLRSGATAKFDRHLASLEARGRRVLGCNPLDSFAWLLMYNTELVHGRSNDASLKFLKMSYDSSPHEAWISVRRNPVAVASLLVASAPLRDQIVAEFLHLIRDGFSDAAAVSYAGAAERGKALLLTHLDNLDPAQRAAFDDVVRKIQIR